MLHQLSNGIGKMKLSVPWAKSRVFHLNVGQSGGSSKKDSNNNATAISKILMGFNLFPMHGSERRESREACWRFERFVHHEYGIRRQRLIERKNNTTTGGKKKGGKTVMKAMIRTPRDSVIILDDSDDDEGGEGGKRQKAKDGGGRRLKRQAAAKAEKNLADNDGLGNIDFDKDDDSDSDDGRQSPLGS